MPSEVTDEQLDKILDEIKAGRKLDAIKLYRKLSGRSLKESKQFIESLIEELGDAVPDAAPGQDSGCGAVLLLIVFTAVASATMLV